MVDVVRPSDRGVLIDLLVVPNASRSEVIGLHGDRVKVRVSAPPERLKANAAVIALVCSTFGVRNAEIVAGRTTRFKTVELIGADTESVVRRIARG